MAYLKVSRNLGKKWEVKNIEIKICHSNQT